MRFALPALLVGLAALVVRATVPPMVPPDPPTLPGTKPAAADKPDPARDLKLVAEVPGKRTIEAGNTPYLKLTLVNTSKTHSYPVVKPGDGSECGWRDPYVHFTAEQRTVQGKWEPITHHHPGRCGLFDSDWPKDVVVLKPGETLNVTEPWGPVSNFQLQYPGRIRVFGHYEYRATSGKRGEPRPVAERGAMGETPPFAVRTEPVEFDVVRPLDLRVKVKQPLKVGVAKKISDVLDVTLTNATAESVYLVAGGPTAAKLAFNGGGPEANQPELTEYAEKSGPQVQLKPGQTLSLVGAGELANGADGKWTGRKPGTYLVRAVYAAHNEASPVEAVVEVPVVE